MRKVKTKTLEVAFFEWGPSYATPVILLHGWPSDAHDWDAVAPVLAQRGLRVLVPTLRGFGQTRFLHATTPRSGQQAALAADLRDFMDVLGIASAFLAGYDWGGRAACIVAALWPQRVQGLVSITGYNIQNLACAHEPAAPQTDRRFWYQWYFQTARGEAALVQRRSELAKCLWQEWSPNWQFDEATFAASAESFKHPDFVAVTVHSYRHRYGNAPGDPAMELIESELARQPVIKVPTIVLHGVCDEVIPADSSIHAQQHFCGPYQRHVIPVVGHFLSREAPQSVIDALVSLIGEQGGKDRIPRAE